MLYLEPKNSKNTIFIKTISNKIKALFLEKKKKLINKENQP